MTDVPIVISATPTAFNADGSLDLAGTRRLFQHVAGSGVDALFVAGTTGEFPALSDGERIWIIASAVSAAGPERVIAHVGAASAYQAANLALEARAMGAQRFAAITPYYLPADPYGVRAYFEVVAAATGDLPLYAYLIPQNSGTRVTPSDLAGLVNDLGRPAPSSAFPARTSSPTCPAGSRPEPSCTPGTTTSSARSWPPAAVAWCPECRPPVRPSSPASPARWPRATATRWHGTRSWSTSPSTPSVPAWRT